MAARDDVLAIGGLSAMGESGDILLVNSSSGAVVSVLTGANGHKSRITGLSFAPGKELAGLASMDVDGRLVFWTRSQETGKWSSQQLTVNENAAGMEGLAKWRNIHPISMLSRNEVVVPYFDGNDEQKLPKWRLAKINVETGSRQVLSPALNHRQYVTALATNTTTGTIASADFEGNLFLTKTGSIRAPLSVKAPLLPKGQFAISLSFSKDGQKLLVGSTTASGEESSTELFDISDPHRIVRLKSTNSKSIMFADLSPDGAQFATATASHCGLHDLVSGTTHRFEARVPVPSRVAFSAADNDYRVAVARGDSKPETAPWEVVFDTEQLQLQRPDSIEPAAWSSPKRSQGLWRIFTRTVFGKVQFYLMFGNVEKGSLPLDSARTGSTVQSEFWISGPDGRPSAVAVGTTGDSDIYVFELADAGVCKLIRKFRGHTGAVVALGLSADQKYLVSGSLDRTVRIWRLDGSSERVVHVDRWGATFDRQENGITIASIREDGPLYLKGMRRGDLITRVRLPKRVNADVIVEPISDPDKMLTALTSHSIDEMVAIDYSRGVVEQKPFQSYPAWPCTVSLFIDNDDEWAYWTPSGYYDASFEGHRLFGWHVNRGAAVRPDFFLASQMRKALERPKIMSRLLDAGSVDEAFRQADARAPANFQWVLQDQQRMAPRVRIESPAADTSVDKRSVELRATVTVPKGQQLVPPKAFANGVVAGQRRLVSQAQTDRDNVFTYEWIAQLPSDQRIELQVLAGTVSEVTGTDEITIRRKLSETAVAIPRLYIAAAAVGAYQDAQIPRLDANVADTLRVVRALEGGASTLYESNSFALLDENVTRASWTVGMRQLANSLRKHVSADDILVVFLSGHGLEDAENQDYYFLPSDVNFANVVTHRYEHCISGADLAMFGDIPCRKIVVLDTCHSGAVQPLRQSQLKSVLRVLQDDLMLTMTASEGSQEAVQSRFAKRLEEGLRGAADQRTGDRNGVVTLKELGEFVRTMVAADSAQDAVRQVPTIGPKRLLEFVEFPLTSVPARSASKVPRHLHRELTVKPTIVP